MFAILTFKTDDMLWNNTKKTWKSSLIVMELSFDFGFDITFNERPSGNYVIRLYKNSPDASTKTLGDQVIGLN